MGDIGQSVRLLSCHLYAISAVCEILQSEIRYIQEMIYIEI